MLLFFNSLFVRNISNKINKQYIRLLTSNTSNKDSNPVKFYINAKLDKSLIIKENKNKSGIYQWINFVTGDFYIGSSSNLGDRLADYYQDAYITNALKHNNRIVRALNKYGYDNFGVSILEYCDKDQLINREQYFIDTLTPVYNILKKAYSSLGCKATPETIVKMRAATLKRLSNKENHPFWDKTHSEETRNKMRLSARNRNYNRSKPFFVYSQDYKLLYSFNTLRETIAFFKADHRTIVKYLDCDLLYRDKYYLKSKLL